MSGDSDILCEKEERNELKFIRGVILFFSRLGNHLKVHHKI